MTSFCFDEQIWEYTEFKSQNFLGSSQLKSKAQKKLDQEDFVGVRI